MFQLFQPYYFINWQPLEAFDKSPLKCYLGYLEKKSYRKIYDVPEIVLLPNLRC